MYSNEQESEIAYYKRTVEDLRTHYDGLIGKLAQAEMTVGLQETRIEKFKEQVATFKKHLNHLRMENDALRSMVPGDCELDLPPQDLSEDPSVAEPAEDQKPLEPLDLDPYAELKVPRFEG